MHMRMHSLSQMCRVLGLPFGLRQVLSRLGLLGANLAIFLSVFLLLPLSLPLDGLGTLALDFLVKFQ